jgi:gamma-glutamyltranspeptidase/glutathione hydrolase
MMVSFIQSNYMGFGSGCVEPTFGISLQNRGHGFSWTPKAANPANWWRRASGRSTPSSRPS